MLHHLKLDDFIQVEPEYVIEFKHFTFNGGEHHIQIAAEYVDTDPRDQAVIIEVSLTNSARVMQLLIATDALRRVGFQDIRLFAPYLPYARQDRVCNPGEALSVKVMCDLINSQNYSRVYTLDNHSDVSTALLNNHKEIDLEQILRRIFGESIHEYALVSPDAGALKRTYKVAKLFGGLPVIECSKKRNAATGEITGVDVSDEVNTINGDLKLLLLDDLADGGLTFIKLAERIKKQRNLSIELYVSHGIFSKGLEVFSGLIDKIHTTKSFKNEITDRIGENFDAYDL